MKHNTFAVTVTVKAPADEVLWFIKYHLDAGADHIYVWLDDPADCLRGLISSSKVTVTACDDCHWVRLGLDDRSSVRIRRSANAVEALRLAREAGIDWLVVIDYDELLRAQTPLPDFFHSIPRHIDAVRLPVWEGLVMQMHNPLPFEKVEWFKPYPVPLVLARKGNPGVYLEWASFLIRLQIARICGVRRASRESFIVGHRSGKTAFRTHLNFTDIGSHEPVPIPGQKLRVLRSKCASVLHFDACDFTIWRHKWERRLNGGLQWVGSRHRHAYMENFVSAMRKGDEALRNFFMETKGLDQKELTILRVLRLIRHYEPRK